MILVLLLACHRHDDDKVRDVPPPYDPPDLVGPWSVGVTEGSGPGPDGLTLTWQVWYPAADTDGLSLYNYGELGTGTATGEAQPDCADPRPVLVISHASGGGRLYLLELAERAASHGVVVIAPDHPGSTREDLDLDNYAAIILRRPLDLAAAYDGVVAAAAVEDAPLAGCLDQTAGYSVFGHDMGATTALMAAGAPIDLLAADAACADGDTVYCQLRDAVGDTGLASVDQSDPRVWAAAALAPNGVLLTGDTAAAIAVPTLILGGRQDLSTPWGDVVYPIFEDLVALPRGAAGVDGAGHNSFTRLCDVQPNYAECGAGYIPPSDARELLNDLAVPFVLYAGGDDKALEFLPPDNDAIFWHWIGS